MTLSPFAKAAVAFTITLVNFLAGLIGDGTWSADDTNNLLLWALTTAGVYLTPNRPSKTYNQLPNE